MTAVPRVQLTALLIAGVLSPLLGCKPSPPPPSDNPPRAAWRPGQARYEVVEVSPPVDGLPESRETFELALSVQGGQAEVSERGLKHVAPFAENGRLEMPITQTPVLYEPIALSVLPPPGQPTTQGSRWSLVRPSDEDALHSTGLVGQERFHYEILANNGDTLEIKISGELRLAWSQGLAQLIEKNTYAPALVVRTAVEKWSPYLEAVAVFDMVAGRTKRVEGDRVPFGFFRDQPVGDEPARVHFTVTEVLP